MHYDTMNFAIFLNLRFWGSCLKLSSEVLQTESFI